MREPVGIKRNERAADNGEDAERSPEAQIEREPRPKLRLIGRVAAERVDDSAEQQGFGEACGGQGDVRQRKRPGQRGLPA
jgi:hypothetical protein